jgi:predicted nucleic acid-binding protein
MALLVDTSALIDYFNGTRCRQSDVLDSVLLDGPPPVTAGIVVQEFLQGLGAAEGNLARRALADFTRLEPPTYAMHEAAAELFRRARRRGCTAATVDTLIVQLAVHYELDLLTRDRVQATLAGIAGVRIA